MQTISLHFEKFGERKGFNPTLGYEFSPNHRLGWQLGIFRDSFDYSSAYVGVNLPVIHFTIFSHKSRLILTLSAVHKQFKKDRGGETRVIPAPILDISLPARLHLNISGVPQIQGTRNHTNGLLFLQLKYHLN